MLELSWSQTAIAFLGALHAAAAYFYFSKAGHASTWALAWLGMAGLAIYGFGTTPLGSIGAFGAAVILWTLWWSLIRALPTRNWVTENAHQATAAIQGERLLVKALRCFEWRSREDFTPRWRDADYDLNQLEAIDLYVSTWGNPRIAHVMVGFVFSASPTLVFSIETRREISERWSTLAGFMKAYELIIIAAPESDLVDVRVEVRRETVHRYRLVSTPMARLRLLSGYVAEINQLAVRPRFYNTIFGNCTTEVARILRAAGRAVPIAWPLLVSGYIPRYFYARGLIDQRLPFSEIESAAKLAPHRTTAAPAPEHHCP